ncbi:MAG: asparaginase [Bacillota bacterium]
MDSCLTVTVTRGELVESVHRVALAVVDAEGRVVHQRGDVNRRRFLRSAAKPLQLLPLLECGAAERLGFSNSELAVMAASHSGEEMHVELLRGVLARLELDVDLLKCGVVPPLSRRAAAALEARDQRPTILHHPCSGKHLAMLALCRDQGWPLDGYLHPDHPVQAAVDTVISSMCSYPRASFARGIDGCGAPVHGVPLMAMALAFSRLAREESEDIRRVRAALTGYPLAAGGTGRLVSLVLAAGKGSLLAKDGSEGLFCVGWAGGGLAMKVEDGSDRALAPAFLEVAGGLGLLDAGSTGLEELRRPKVRTSRGEEVGYVACSGLETDLL